MKHREARYVRVKESKKRLKIFLYAFIRVYLL